jgi:hypothetical protein
MSAPDRRALVDRGHGALSVRRQCELVSVACSGVYRPPGPTKESDLALSPAPAPGARQPHAHASLARGHHRRARRNGCGHDACPPDKLGQRRRVAHMPTAATAARDSNRLGIQERRNGPCFQLRNRSKWPYAWGPLQSDSKNI